MTMKRSLLLTATALIVLCGCSSFDVLLEMPGSGGASVMLYANAVQEVRELEGGQAIRLPSGVWRVRLAEEKMMIRLPFVPNELLLSVNAEGREGVFRIESEEGQQGSLGYKVKSISGGTKSWAISVESKDQSGMVIRIDTGKSK
jgi:hypothetical protein